MAISLDAVHKTEYLGLVILDKLSWKEHKGYISTKIRRNTGIMFNNK